MSERATFDAMRLFRAYREFVAASDAWISDTGDVQGALGFREMLVRETDVAIARAARLNAQVRGMMPTVDAFVKAHCFAREKPKAEGPAEQLKRVRA